MTRLLADLRRGLTQVGRAVRGGWTGFAARPAGGVKTNGDTATRRTVLDKLIDGESVTVTGAGEQELGYLIGFTDRKMPTLVRQLLLSKVVPQTELEAFRALTSDLSRDLPEEVTMVYWEGLPLAVWCPAGHLKEFSFNPN